MACQKVYKQGRDGIIVKVNLHSPILTSFYISREPGDEAMDLATMANVCVLGSLHCIRYIYSY